MDQFLPSIEFPELFFGFVAPIGVNVDDTIQAFKRKLEHFGYRAVEIGITDKFEELSKYIVPNEKLITDNRYERYTSFISYGNQLRSVFGNEFLALSAVNQIYEHRKRLKKTATDQFSKTAYLIRQLKRPEEVRALRKIYGRLFLQISIYSRRIRRVSDLSRLFAHDRMSADYLDFRPQAEKLVTKDENEFEEENGQRVQKIFHDADFIVNSDIDISVETQVDRYIEILFGSNSKSPTKIEYGMFAAKAAALRTLDLSRQVGAAIFSPNWEILALGSNEVPKAGGGTYWTDDGLDAREHTLGTDSNARRKKEILTEVLRIILPEDEVSRHSDNPRLQESQLMDALEYGRIIHAEMSAISDAARIGRSTKASTLFCTTFPCHMCAKHIVASGIDTVYYLEPYPKSLAFNLHPDSIDLESRDRGAYKNYPSTKFLHFFGITPRRYSEFFERTSRKNTSDGNFLPYKNGLARPIFDIPFEYYAQNELLSLHQFANLLSTASRDAAEQENLI